MNKPEEVDFNKQMFVPMLNLFVNVTESLNKRILPPMEYDHLQGLTYKIYIQANTAYYLAHGTPVLIIDKLAKVIDRSSMMNLARSALESCAVFYHLFIIPRNDDVKNFRFLNSTLRGLNTRKNAKPSTEEGKAKLRREAVDITQLYVDIQNTQHYKNLKAKIKENLDLKEELRQKDFDRRIKDFDRRIKNGKYEELTKVDMLKEAGISENVAGILYGIFSDHSHSGYISLLQAIPITTLPSENDKAEEVLWHFLMALCLTIDGMAKLFPEVQKVLDETEYPTYIIPIVIEQFNKLFDEIEEDAP